MTHWRIIEVERHREQAARSLLSNAGYTVYLPVIIKRVRPHKARSAMAASGICITKETPLLPGIAFAAIQDAQEADVLSVRYVGAIWPGMCLAHEMQAFADAVDHANQLSFALGHRNTKQKRLVVKDLKQLGEALLESARREMEEAA